MEQYVLLVGWFIISLAVTLLFENKIDNEVKQLEEGNGTSILFLCCTIVFLPATLLIFILILLYGIYNKISDFDLSIFTKRRFYKQPSSDGISMDYASFDNLSENFKSEIRGMLLDEYQIAEVDDILSTATFKETNKYIRMRYDNGNIDLFEKIPSYKLEFSITPSNRR